MRFRVSVTRFFSTGQQREGWPLFRFLSNHHRKASIMNRKIHISTAFILTITVMAVVLSLFY